MCNEDESLWVVFNGEIFNYRRAAAGAGGARAHLPDAQRHRGDRPRLRGVGRRGLRALQRPVRDRAVGRASASGSRWPRDRVGVRPLYYAEHGGRILFASEVKALFAADPSLPRAFDPVGARSDVHVLVARWRRGRCSPASPSSSRAHVRRHRRGRDPRQRPFWTAALPRPSAVHGHRSTRRRRRCGAALRARHGACASCARTCRSAATCPAGSTARSSRRWAWRPRATGCARSRCASRTPSSTRPTFQRAVVRAPRQRAPRRSSCTRADIAAVVPDGHRPHRAPDPAHRAGAALPALEAGARLGHQGGADRRGRRRDVRGLRPLPRGARCAGSGRGSPSRSCGRGCSSGSIRTWRAPRCRSRRWRASSSGRTSAARVAAGLLARHALADHQRAQAAVHARPAQRARRARRARRLLALAARGVRRLELPRPGSVPRDPHPAVRLHPVVAGRSHADGPLGRGALPVPRRRRDGAGELAARRATSCAVLDEKHVLKRIGAKAAARQRVEAEEAALPRARRAVVRGPRRAATGSRRCYERGRHPQGGRVRAARSCRASGRSARPAATSRSSPTPTTWRWSACCPPSLLHQQFVEHQAPRSVPVDAENARRTDSPEP